ncbi:MAG: hypothetical protein JWM54_580 [Acidobacteriaceae bacterium]|jgi:hypothetical protein|nr:hypothetical protein [Acidobacteriaceae bacterium]
MYRVCDEYRRLELEYRYAQRRIWRYLHPHADPILSMTPDAPSEEQVERAHALVDELQQQIEAHVGSCEHCRIADKVAI